MNNDNDNNQRTDLTVVPAIADSPQLSRRSNEVLKADDSPHFYWELAGDEYTAAHRDALEDEGYLANDLLTGAKILAVPEHYEECPVEVRLPPPGVEATLYTDAIAAIGSAQTLVDT